MGLFLSSRRTNSSYSNESQEESINSCFKLKYLKNKSNSNQFNKKFYLAGKEFESLKCQSFLFGDKFDLNLIISHAKPNDVSYTINQTSTKFLQSLIHLRKDTIKLIKKDSSDKYNIEFRFDCDIDVKIEIIYFAIEIYTKDRKLNYKSTCNEYYNNDLMVYTKGSNNLFKQEEHFINPSKYTNWQFLPSKNPVYPIVIKCSPIDKNYSSHCHVTLATLEKTTDGTSYSFKILKQKQLINGILFNLQEVFGIEKKIDVRLNEELKSSSCVDIELKSFKSNDTQQGILECVICMSDTRDTLLLPCRHLCICKMCANNLRVKSNTCPICRIPFNALLQIQLIKTKRKLSKNFKIVSIYEAFNGKAKRKEKSCASIDDAVVPVVTESQNISQLQNIGGQRKAMTEKLKRKSLSMRRSLRFKRKDSESNSVKFIPFEKAQISFNENNTNSDKL